MSARRAIADAHPPRRLSVQQVLEALHMQVMQNVLHRPPGLTIRLALGYEFRAARLLVHIRRLIRALNMAAPTLPTELANSYQSPDMAILDALRYEAGATRVLANARYLLNSFNVAAHAPLDILVTIPSYLPIGQCMFVLSQVCRHWRMALASSAKLWTEITCRSMSRTCTSLERHRLMPLQLKLDPGFSAGALNMVFAHGARISSFSAHISLAQIQFLYPQLAIRSMEELILFAVGPDGEEDEVNGEDDEVERALTMNIQGLFVSLRKLSISGLFVPIDRIETPNLIHLSLERLYSGSRTRVPSILCMLRRCPQLETIVLNFIEQDEEDYDIFSDGWPTVTLPMLRAIDLGSGEVSGRLVMYLQFPPTVDVGFRMETLYDFENDWDSNIFCSVESVLSRIHIQSITLAASTSPDNDNHEVILTRFEGLQGSLEVCTSTSGYDLDIIFDPHEDLLFGRFNGNFDVVRILNILDCSEAIPFLAERLPNITSINFLNRSGGKDTYGALSPTNPLSPPYTKLECVTGVSPDPGLVGMAKARKECGVPLKTVELLVDKLGDMPEEFVELSKYVEQVKFTSQTRNLGWGTDNVILEAWEGAGHRAPESVTWARRYFSPESEDHK